MCSSSRCCQLDVVLHYLKAHHQGNYNDLEVQTTGLQVMCLRFLFEIHTYNTTFLLSSCCMLLVSLLFFVSSSWYLLIHWCGVSTCFLKLIHCWVNTGASLISSICYMVIVITETFTDIYIYVMVKMRISGKNADQWTKCGSLFLRSQNWR